MLESEEVSVNACWRNSLIVDKYTREDIWPQIGKVDEHRAQVDILFKIKNDMFALLNTQKGDIREFLANQCGNDNKSAFKLSSFIRKAKKVRYQGKQEEGIIVDDWSDGEGQAQVVEANDTNATDANGAHANPVDSLQSQMEKLEIEGESNSHQN